MAPQEGRFRAGRLATLLLGILTLAAVPVVFLSDRSNAVPGKGVEAMEFPKNIRWLNTDAPVTLASLRGRVVLLDFWTYCCINCLHTLPVLGALERQYADRPVTVLGIHSGKFDQEHDGDRVREAIAKYEVHHPVAMDEGFVLWRAFGVRAWPTLVVLDTRGRAAEVLSGEPELAQLARIVDGLLAAGARDGTLAGGAGPMVRGAVAPTAGLRFPGKVLAFADRLFIADSGHHRVIVADADGRVRDVYGGPDAGFVDGPVPTARFAEPQGMARDGDLLYVADRRNHAIRVIDLAARTVRTVAGTGRKGAWHTSGGDALMTDLRSPWDLVLRDGGLDIAMAGTHQLWRYEPAAHQVEVLAGNGAEALADGNLASSSFAQPSGLWLSGPVLYVADSEASAVRAVDLAAGRVTTLVGTGLFDFGMKDGRGQAAQLQHPIGIAGKGRVVYVADSFNNAIRTIDTADGNRVATLALRGAGDLSEPQGLSIAGDTLFVADTNHHRILAVDLRTLEAREVPLAFPPS